MGVWDTYQKRIEAHGATKREAALVREVRMLNSKTKDSLSFHSVLINDIPCDVSIKDSDNLNEKMMISLPGEDFECGALVFWANNYWLISEKDANNEVYTRAKLIQCNYLLKWIDESNIIHEQWCVIEDGTKYMPGELEDRNFVASRGDSRVAMFIGKNEHTVKFGREHRFIIDDPDTTEKNAFTLSKPLKVGRTYNNQGVYAFVLQEVVSTDYDNMELRIADYYKHFPPSDNNTEGNDITSGKKVWF